MTTWRVRGLLLALLVLLGAGVLVYETWWDDFSSLSHYEALSVHESASLRDVKRAFRERSLQYHPDKASLATGTTELNTRRFHRISDAYRVLSDEGSRAAYDLELQEQARFRAMQRQSWRVKLTPTTPGWQSTLQFYLTEFPFVLATLALQMMDVRLFLMFLVCLGCAIFAFDLVVRVVWRVWDVTFSSSAQSTASRKSNDAAMRAARLRQQQALEETRRTKALTQRRVTTRSQ